MGRKSRNKKQRSENPTKTARADAPQAQRRRLLPWLVFGLGIILGVVIWVLYDFSWGATTAVVGAIVAGALDAFTDPPPPKGGGSADAINFGN